MNILVIGAGYVGTTTAVVLSEMGWNVTGLDVDDHKIKQLQQGLLPFYENDLGTLLKKHLRGGNLHFTTQTEKAIKDHDVIFICVGTPSHQDGSADMQYVKQVATQIGQWMNEYKLIVIKSTVPVGTQEKVVDWVRAAQGDQIPYDVINNPEFLREGKALMDALQPDRIIIGANSDQAAKQLQMIYQSLNCPIVVTNPRTSELIKYAANAYLATKITYMNELSGLCDKLGVNVKEVALGIGLDPRIGSSFLRAGIGYGGSCFPKDVSALLRTASEHDTELTLLEKVAMVNEKQYLTLLDKARIRLGSFSQTKIAVLGLAFKPETDDIREAPAIRMISSLLAEQAHVTVHDPVAKLPTGLFAAGAVQSCTTPEQALQGADAVFLCTEWATYQHIDWMQMKQIMNEPNLFDGRNIFDAKQMTAFGFHYQGVGYR